MQAFSYEENKINWHDVGHMTKMAAKPIYVMNLSKYSPEPLDRFARNFVCSIYIKPIIVCPWIDLDIFDIKVKFQS